MDEGKQTTQTQPSKITTALLRILKPINAILVGITLLTSIFILLDAALPHLGITINFSTHGNSMDPTIRGNAFVVISTAVPFEELNPGDVILFKEPKGLNTATDKIKVHISKVDEDGSPSSDSASPGETASGSASASESIYSLENIEYLPDRAVLHRIVEITTAEGIDGAEGSSTLLITQGDANPYLDRYTVSTDSYLGCMLWHIDYVGAVLLFFYERLNLLIIIATVSVTLVTILLRSNMFKTTKIGLIEL